MASFSTVDTDGEVIGVATGADDAAGDVAACATGVALERCAHGVAQRVRQLLQDLVHPCA